VGSSNDAKIAGRVLVAEDDRFYRQILGKRLMADGHEVMLTANGEEAWQVMRGCAPEVVVTDWMMPRLDGYALCRKIKAEPGLEAIYCILLTARDRTEDKVSALDVGADDYLLKPCDDDELLARVRTGLRVHRRYQRLEADSLTDPLTGLGNRRSFDQRISEEVARCRRNHLPLSLVMLDLDRFKQINDEHGHPAGDAVLREVGRVLRSRMRAGEVAARIGGDEFAVLLPSADRAGAEAFAEWIERALARLDLGDLGFTVSGSLGCAQLGDGGTASLVRDADRALYRAKRARAEEPVAE